MKQLKFLLIPLMLMLLSACATQQPSSEALDQARQAVSEAEDNAAVVRHAPVALREAQESLRQAEKSAKQGENPKEVEHYAYLAQKRAQIAQAQARREVLAQSTQTVEQQRAQIQLEAREKPWSRPGARPKKPAAPWRKRSAS